jgi:preprotein translocase subunit SecA
MAILTKLLPSPSQSFLRKYGKVVARINDLEKEYAAFPDTALAEKTRELKQKIQDKLAGKSQDPLALLELSERVNEKKRLNQLLESVLPEAFALVREAAKRTVGERHFDVQLYGGIALHLGNIAEMRTGEGKTLVATLPLYLNSLLGRGAHLVTVNDYLAKHAVEWYGPVYDLLGVSVGVIVHDTQLKYVSDPGEVSESNLHPHLVPVTRREAYACDITYGTNNEFGFDYLRDNMATELEHRVQGELFYAIVDEVDSILIDEARTPLIISGPAEEAADLYSQFARLIPRLKPQVDFAVDEKERTVTLTHEGIGKMEGLLGVENIYGGEEIQLAYHLEEALKAHILFKRDKDYVVQDGEVIIVDEFTGRLMPGRRYSEGLHQAIEAKEGVAVQRESETLATISFQNLFRLYTKLAGMTGTAATEAEEFLKIYGLDVLVIPTNKPMIRKDLADRVYKLESGKYAAVVADVKARNTAGQPILIGTISVEKNEQLSRLLKKAGVPHEVLNAKNHEREAQIIASAGRKGSVTLATNMAGRGTDIILGGRPPKKEECESDKAYEAARKQWEKEHEEVLALGGLHVIGTERHESRRIDNQLRGRSGRQGDPGSSQFYLSSEDDLMRIFGGDRLKNWLNAMGLPDDEPIEHSFLTRAIASAQKRVEGLNFDMRKRVVQYDDVLNRHREVIYKRRYRILRAASEAAKAGQVPDGKEKDPEGAVAEEAVAAGASGGLAELEEMVERVIQAEARRLVGLYASGYHTEWNLGQLARETAALLGLGEPDRVKLEDELGQYQSNTGLEGRLTSLFQAAYRHKQNEFGPMFGYVLRSVYLRMIDMLWVEHLTVMQELRTGIGLRTYAQTDPLVAYKAEGYRLFQNLLSAIDTQTVRTIFRVERVVAA